MATGEVTLKAIQTPRPLPEYMYVYMYCHIKNEGLREGLKVLKTQRAVIQ